jgi:hypothetical protein
MLPQPYVSARQALELIFPFMARFKPHWGLTMLSAYGFRLPDGRGIWQARWRYGDSEDIVEVVLLEDGRLIFRGESSPSYAWDLLPNAIKLPERRLDSTDIAAIVARLPVPRGFAATSLGSMTLRSFKDHPHLWEILFPAIGMQSDRSHRGSSILTLFQVRLWPSCWVGGTTTRSFPRDDA